MRLLILVWWLMSRWLNLWQTSYILNQQRAAEQPLSAEKFWELCENRKEENENLSGACFIVLADTGFWYTESYGRLCLGYLSTILHVFLTLKRYTQIRSSALFIKGIFYLSNQLCNLSNIEVWKSKNKILRVTQANYTALWWFKSKNSNNVHSLYCKTSLHV